MEQLLDVQELYNENTSKRIPASKGKRFSNYLIDLAFFYVLSMIFGVLLFVFSDTMGNAEDLIYEDDPYNDLMVNLVSVVIYLLYYLFSEYFMNGKTIGKYLTKTRVITTDGRPLSFGTILKRSLIRIIPFEPFSFLSGDSGWHDNGSDTMVINETDYRQRENWFNAICTSFFVGYKKVE
jgi:uncharacterized RDD family membrane protein YckC